MKNMCHYSTTYHHDIHILRSNSRIGSFPGADSHDSPGRVHEVVKATETLINESVVQDTHILIKEGKESDS